MRFRYTTLLLVISISSVFCWINVRPKLLTVTRKIYYYNVTDATLEVWGQGWPNIYYVYDKIIRDDGERRRALEGTLFKLDNLLLNILLSVLITAVLVYIGRAIVDWKSDVIP